MIYNSCLSAQIQKYVRNITKNLLAIGDMTYVREVTETDFYNCMCLYFQFDSFCIFSELFELVSLLSKQFNAFKILFCCQICFPYALL